MEIQYFGGNCLKLATKKATLVIDDTLEELGGKSVTKDGEVVLYTEVAKPIPAGHYGFNSPGEHEIAEISIYGVPARRHMDEPGVKQSVMYRIINDDIKVVVLGNIHPDLSNEQLEALGMVDVLIVPVGGHGYTTDPVGALQLIKKIEPKIVIPVHYDDGKLQYPVPQLDLEHALKEMSMQPARTEPKFKLKPSELPEQAQLWILER